MCVITPALAATVAGTALKFAAERGAIRRADRERAAAGERQADYQRRASQVVSQAIEPYRAPVREQALEQAEQGAIAAFQGDIDRARAQGEGTLGTRIQGRVSEDYDVARAEAARDQIARAARLAQLLGKVTGPTRLRETERVGLGDAATQIGQLGNFSSGQYGVDQLRIQQAGQPSALLYGTGALLSGAGRGMAMAGTPAPKADPSDWTKYGPPPGLDYPSGKALR